MKRACGRWKGGSMWKWAKRNPGRATAAAAVLSSGVGVSFGLEPFASIGRVLAQLAPILGG